MGLFLYNFARAHTSGSIPLVKHFKPFFSKGNFPDFWEPDLGFPKETISNVKILEVEV